MQLHILFEFKNNPWGGANQFLQALRGELRRQNSYHDNPNDADALVVNLNPGNLLPALKQTSKIKSHQPDKIIVARIDGPTSLVRGRDDKLDRLLFSFINMFADGVIYQSHWSKRENNKIVQTKPPYETVIYNAADPKIFTPKVFNGAPCERIERPFRLGPRRSVSEGGAKRPRPSKAAAGAAENERAGSLREIPQKTKLIATSWSPNPRKGFGIYRYLDQHLDFSRYSLTFVGNSPLTFKNIKHIKPIPSPRLANLLRQHDIYITASQNDPCSNALIEAISCGLPPVALAEGGHPELVQRGGELFAGQEDIIQKINLVAQNLASYQENLPRHSIATSSDKYLSFAKQIHHDVELGKHQPKHVNLLTRIKTAQIRALHYL